MNAETKESILKENETETLEKQETGSKLRGLPFDADAVQTIPLTVSKGTRTLNTAIELKPLPDEEWFELLERSGKHIKQTKSISLELFAPQAEVARRLAVKAVNYPARSDWRAMIPDDHFVQALILLLQVTAVADESDETIFSFDEDSPVRLLSAPNGVETETRIWFKEASKADIDEYLAASNGEPQPNALASAVKISQERRFFALYEKLYSRSENYKSRIPAWHAVTAVKAHLDAYLSGVGKLLMK